MLCTDVVERLFEFAEDATARTTDEGGADRELAEVLANAEAELEAALDGRLADALGGNGKLPVADRARLFLAGEGPPVPVRGRRGSIRTLAPDGLDK